jgi:ABC-type oligopeptide transport system substrate-binding subunit
MALAVTACGGGDDNGGNTPSDGNTSAAEGGTLNVYASEPAYLFPGMTNETAGSAVMNALFSPLVDYDQNTGDPYPVVAAELPTSDSNDNTHWTIKIKDGWTFHNGEAVTAKSFVDAWNWAAYGPNAANNGYFFGPGMADVVGYADVQSGEDPDGEEGAQTAPAPAATEMSGLAVVDDLTFTVELAQPFSQFPLMLGYTGFYPVPSACITDWQSCNEAPIGNGPFKMDGEWNHDQGVTVVKYDDYAGENKPHIDGIDFHIYADPQTGFLDLKGGQIDYMTAIPPEEVPAARDDFGDRFIDQASSTFQYIGFPLWDERFGFGGVDTNYGGEQGQNLRHALSMAINREELIDTVFDGAYAPADSLVSPVVQGYREGACSDWCTYDVDAAKALYADSPGISGPINFWFNEGASHEEWLTAVGNYWSEAFGIEYQLQARVWADYLQAQGDHQLDGPFRLGWVMDYPSAQNYLAPIYGEGSGEGNFGYVNDEANQLMAQGNSAASVDEGLALYNQAEDLILTDMPNIPMWFGRTIGAYNEDVSNVAVDKFGNLDFTTVTVSQ